MMHNLATYVHESQIDFTNISFKFYNLKCVREHMHVLTPIVWKSVNNFQELLRSFYHVGPGIELKSSDLLTSFFTILVIFLVQL